MLYCDFDNALALALVQEEACSNFKFEFGFKF